MPYPAQIDRDRIVEMARQLIEQDGIERLSLRQLAQALGVQAPSLYRHIKNKTALLQAINQTTTRKLIACLRAVSQENGQALEARLMALAQAYRQFAHAHPACYQLANSSLPEHAGDSADDRENLVLPLQALFTQLTQDDERAFAALRGAYAFLHGWVMLELTQQFQRGGDLDAHFEQAFLTMVRGWQLGDSDTP